MSRHLLTKKGKRQKGNPPMMPTSHPSAPVDNNINSVVSHSTDSTDIINYTNVKLNLMYAI